MFCFVLILTPPMYTRTDTRFPYTTLFRSHLSPGMEKTEMIQGRNPQAPILFKGSNRSASEQFWIIKHGIKMTAMPAWGKTHDDRLDSMLDDPELLDRKSTRLNSSH